MKVSNRKIKTIISIQKWLSLKDKIGGEESEERFYFHLIAFCTISYNQVQVLLLGFIFK
jgi:hypothetical protein